MNGENVSTTVALDVSVSPKCVSNSPSGVLILEENNDHMPSEEEILMYATSIGIDAEKEPELIYLAREGISAPLPEGWSAIQDKDNNIFYHECSTGRTTQDHPMDALYRKLVAEARKRKTTNATNTTAGTTAVADQKPLSSPKPPCSSAEGQRAPEGAQSVTSEKKPPVASLGPVSDDLPTTYQALPFPHMRRSVQTSAAPSLFRTPVDRVPDRRAGPLHHSPFLVPDSTRVSLDKTALVTAERRLSALQAHVHCLKTSTDVNTVRNADYLTPADRWFWSAARPKSPRPHTAQPAAKVRAEEMPHLETSPSSQLRQKPPRVLGEINNYVDHPTGGRAGVGVDRLREEQVASDSDRENARSRRGRIQAAEEGGDGDALNLQFSRALRLSGRTPAVDAAIPSGHFERHKESGVAGLYSLYSPPGSSGGKEGVHSGAASCGSCAASHSQYRPQSGDIRTEPVALPTCFLPSPTTTTTSPTAFDANLGLRCMMDERARLQRKMTCLKLTYKAYKMKLAEMDSGLRMLYSAASSASSPYVTFADALPSGPSPRPSVRDRSLSVHRRPPNEDRSNMTSSESSVGGGGGGGTVSPSDHRHSLSRYPASAMHQSDLYLNTLAGRPLIKHRLYRQSELTRLQTPEALPRFRRSSSHSASRGL
ncbi:hypothetical protein SprV_0602079200 [Sparganum proliferum]